MYRVVLLIARIGYRLGFPVRRLERYGSALRNKAVFHKKYGKGRNCKLVGCSCKK